MKLCAPWLGKGSAMPRRVAVFLAVGLVTLMAGVGTTAAQPRPRGGLPSTATPIKHLVVIFQENVSFDHYFGTYPHAANINGEPFHPKPGTPSVNGLNATLLHANPNLANPQRLNPSQAMTCDNNHQYQPEQVAFDHGLMNGFVQATGNNLTLAQCLAQEYKGNGAGLSPPPVTANQNPANDYAVMDYFDGNTVTGLWNYAQHFSLSDNFYGTNFGPSSPGALNVTSATTYGVICGPAANTYWPGGSPDPAAGGSPSSGPATTCSLPPGVTPTTLSTGEPPAGPVTRPGPATIFNDTHPYYDICSYIRDHAPASATLQMGGSNIGDLLDQAHITWGWFQGGFADGFVPGQGKTPPSKAQICNEQHKNLIGNKVYDYIPHHDPFQFYAATANPQHLPPTSVAAIGHTDQANHQYGLGEFWAAADSGHLPAVSYLKARGYEDGHAGYSDPINEQHFLVRTINRLERLPSWRSTAVLITWDDSDGWYDHQVGPIQRYSQTSLDAFSNPGQCGASPALVPFSSINKAREEARCGVGPRIPLLAISPFAKRNFVDNTFTDQSSIVRFIEDNWLHGKRLGDGAADATAGSLRNMFNFVHPRGRRLFLNPTTGEPIGRSGGFK